MTPMLMLIMAVWIESGILFYRALKDSMEDPFRWAASILFGFSVAMPILLTSIHTEILPGVKIAGKKIGFPELFGLFSTILVLMLFDVFATRERHVSWYVLVGFLSVFIGLIDYLYAHLYVGKQKADSDEINTQRELEHKTTMLEDAQLQLEEYHEKLLEATKRHKASQLRLNEAHEKLNEIEEKFTCPYCKEVLEIKPGNALKNHKHRCDKNPSNQQL